MERIIESNNALIIASTRSSKNYKKINFTDNKEESFAFSERVGKGRSFHSRRPFPPLSPPSPSRARVQRISFPFCRRREFFFRAVRPYPPRGVGFGFPRRWIENIYILATLVYRYPLFYFIIDIYLVRRFRRILILRYRRIQPGKWFN